jgi:hypothetical protein
MYGKTATSLPYSVHTMVPDHQDLLPAAANTQELGTLTLNRAPTR